MYPSVTNVAASADYMLVVDFDNGESRRLIWISVSLKRLKDTQEFARVRVSFDTIEWPSGVDLDPEFVYSKSVAAR